MTAPVSLAKANDVFSLALFKMLSENDKTANIFYSPLSISSALSMVLQGAKGETYEEMVKVQEVHFKTHLTQCENEGHTVYMNTPSSTGSSGSS